MSVFPTSYPRFLESELEPIAPEKALFHIIPAPFEATVSYGGGTGKGALAILRASSQLELWDGESVPADEGLYTHRPVCRGRNPERALADIAVVVEKTVGEGKIPVMLGGEHTVTWGALRGTAAALAAKRKGDRIPDLLQEEYTGPAFGVVQIDAHADLRHSYEGSVYSHACVMRRACEMGLPVYQLGIRSYCTEEEEYRRARLVPGLTGRELAEGDIQSVALPADFPEEVYLTIDIDGFDSTLFPTTGTPVPGGIGWYQGLNLIRSVACQRNIIGFDLVEHAPAKGNHAVDFAAAQLVYNVMGIIQRSRCVEA